jgi:D-alanine-D-alanine ligase
MKVVILHDRIAETSRPDEVDVLIQAEAVSQALSRLGHEPVRVSIGLDLSKFVDSLRDLRPAFVFNLVESVEGRGNLIALAPAILDSMGVPYTGSPTEALFVTSSKLLAKKMMWARGIPTPPWVESGEKGSGPQTLEGLFIVKSVWEHASVGLDDGSVFEPRSHQELRERLKADHARLGGECFAEAYVEGREFNTSLLAGAGGPEVVAAAEIKFVNYAEDKLRVVGYPAKWEAESFEYRNTPRTFDFPTEDGPLISWVKGIALDCWRLFGLRGYARVDLRVDAEGQPWVLEVNANPCLSPDAGFAAALEWAGISFDTAIARIVDDSLGH